MLFVYTLRYMKDKRNIYGPTDLGTGRGAIEQ